MNSTVNFTLRIDEELLEKIRYISEVKKRSTNSQILYILEKYVSNFENQKNDNKN